MRHEMKVFAINDCEWWAGPDIESVKAGFIAAGYGDESSFDDPHEVPDPEMKRLTFVDDISDENSPKSTFREHLDLMVAQGVEFPCFFASTEY